MQRCFQSKCYNISVKLRRVCTLVLFIIIVIIYNIPALPTSAAARCETAHWVMGTEEERGKLIIKYKRVEYCKFDATNRVISNAHVHVGTVLEL